MKTQIDTAKIIASDKMIMDSVRSLSELVGFQPAGRTESRRLICEAVAGAVDCDAMTEDVEKY